MESVDKSYLHVRKVVILGFMINTYGVFYKNIFNFSQNCNFSSALNREKNNN